MDTENIAEPKKTFLRRFWWILVAAVLIIAAIVFGIESKKEAKNDEKIAFKETKDQVFDAKDIWPSADAKYITAVPVDLTQIQSISKYRGCAGHIRDGYSFDRELENDRSMKHYLYPVPAYQGTMDKVKLFAPFDGIVQRLDLESEKVGGRPHNGNGIHFSTEVDPNVDFVLGHLYFVKEFKVGDKVKAGELVGYAALYDKGNDFDIDLSTPGGTNAYNGREILGSAFDHMTDFVLAEFAKYGITPENTKFTKEYADAHPCNYNKPDDGQDAKEEKLKDLDGHHNINFVQLVH